MLKLILLLILIPMSFTKLLYLDSIDYVINTDRIDYIKIEPDGVKLVFLNTFISTEFVNIPRKYRDIILRQLKVEIENE